ncbi:MAG: leucine-rich repeat domain-containing protein [Candidatus Neoclostridium sp.]
MKSVRKICLIIISCALLSLFAACNGTLSAPEDVFVDLENELSWSTVDGASIYTVEISSKNGDNLIELIKEEQQVNTYSFESRRTSVDLGNSNKFTLSEGDYIIKIKALGKTKGASDSDWSEAYEFHKEYETGCVYALINGGTEYEISRVGKASGAIVLEDFYRGKPVTQIAAQAFRNSVKITEVTLGSNVRSIGKNAFASCSKLEKVTLPESLVEIGESAFRACYSLKEINVPSGVKDIQYSTFAFCSSLGRVTLNEGLETIGEDAFASSVLITEITLPDSVKYVAGSAFSSGKALETVNFGAGVTEIGDYAFSRCDKLKKINFSANSSLEKLGSNAFSFCSELSGVVLPDGLQDIGEACFYGDTAMGEISIPETVAHVGVGAFERTGLYNASGEYVYADNWLVSYKAPLRDVISLGTEQIKEGTFAIADSVFALCQRLSEVRLPSSVEIVGNQAFAACPYLTKVIMPKVKAIGVSAFMSCEILNNVDFGDSLQTIERYAFYGCVSFDNNKYAPEDTLPDTVRKIGGMAFYDTLLWKNANNVVFCGKWAVGTVMYGVKDEIFGSWMSITSADLTVAENGKDKITCVGIADYTFLFQNKLRTIAGMEDVRYIGEGAFLGCEMLTTVTLSDDVRDIPDYAFAYCNNLTRFNAPERLRSVGKSAFYNCARLAYVELPDSTESIGAYAFSNCVNLTEFTIPSEVTEIKEFTFFGSRIKSITIPANVVKIGKKAFANFSSDVIGIGGLSSITFEEGVKEIGYAAFCYSSLTEIKLPDSLQTIEKSLFYGAWFLKEVEIGSGVTEIGDFAFYGSGLESVTVPENVNTIGAYAFANIADLKSVMLKGSLGYIKENAFYADGNATVFVEGARPDEGWTEGWNSSFLPEIYGCEFSPEGYLVSFTVTPENLKNARVVVKKFDEEDKAYYEEAFATINASGKKGYECVGFSTTPDATEAEYSASEALSAPEGTVLYAVWKEIVEDLPEPEQPDDSDNVADPSGDDDFMPLSGVYEFVPRAAIDALLNK